MSKEKCVCNTKHDGTCKNPRIIRSIEKDMPILNYSLVEGNLKHIQGQVLTLIEAIILDKQQLSATKDIIKYYFNAKLTHLYDMYGEENREMPDYEPTEKQLD